MRKLFLSLLVSVGFMSGMASAFASGASPEFSAFASEGKLYVTALVDTCNHVGASLWVEPLCREDRMTRNYASDCSVELKFFSTPRGDCPVSYKEPQVFYYILDESNVASEAKSLSITVNRETIEIEINR